MNIIKKHAILSFILCTAFIVTACSDDSAEKKETKGDHVWKQQTDVLKSAKEMSKKMQQSLKEQQQKLNDSE